MSSSFSPPVDRKFVDTLLHRAEELDALNAVLPFDRRDQLAELLTDDDVATLKHLAREVMGQNTMRALASDLGYLEAWCLWATSSPLPWPAPENLLLKFVAQHLWDPAEREQNPEHGMPEDITNILREKRLLKREKWLGLSEQVLCFYKWISVFV